MNKNQLLIGVLAPLLFTSCASILSGSRAKVTVKNDDVLTPVNLTYDGKTESNVFLPYKIKIKRGFKPTTIKASAKGYDDVSVNVKKKFNSTTLGNLILGGIPGAAVDAATGAMMEPVSTEIFLPFKVSMNNEPVENYVTTSPNNNIQERVTREKPGQTSMERTIIRWFFESDPQGARIMWRVISNVPDEVKNTNELYLGTTPYEDTRGFNIVGLTERNAANVQIEIKLKRKGYLDQTKRFNVRQAIDQQEISAFFDMVKE